MSQIYEEDLESRLLRFAGERGDATIVTYLRAGRAQADRLTETLEKLVYALSKEKADIQAKYVEYINRDVRPLEFLPMSDHRVSDLADTSLDTNNSSSNPQEGDNG